MAISCRLWRMYKGLDARSVRSESPLCFSELVVHGLRHLRLDNTGEDSVGCVEERDRPVHLRVAVGALAFVNLHYRRHVPVVRSLGRVEDLGKEAR